MQAFTIVPYADKDFQAWNRFVEDSNNGTIFHRLDFLSYHGDRFKNNENHLMIFKDKALFAVLPLGIFKDGGKQIARSPFGASNGGPVFNKPPNYSESRDFIKTLVEYLRSQKVNELHFMLNPGCYEKIYCETFRFALLEEGFVSVKRDITSVIALNETLPEAAMLKRKAADLARKVRKAKKAGIEIHFDSPLDDFKIVFEKTYNRLQKKATHTIEELKTLSEKVKGISFEVGYVKDKPVVGICHFAVNRQCLKTFYLCQDFDFKETQCLTYLIYESIMESKVKGYAWYDLGTSSTDMVGKTNIFQFKESLGSLGQFRESFVLRFKN